MLIPTHCLISKHIFKSITINNGIKLDYSAFKFGSFAPDIMPKYKKNRHYMTSSFDYVINQVVKLYEDSKYDQISIEEFSFRLGVISHYLADFFCKPHNEIYYDNHLIKHLIYEKNLHKYYHKYNDYSIMGLHSIDISDRIKLKTDLEDLHSMYEKSEEENFIKDTNFSMMVLKLIANSMVEAYCITENSFIVAPYTI